MKEANQILLDLKRKIYKPIYFLSGEEPYYIDLISDYIESNVLDDADKEFNQNIVYGKDADLVSILGLAKQFPMMSEHQVVIVKEAQNIKELNKSAGGNDVTGASKTSTNSATQQFANYIANPQPTTILVFCFKYKTIDKRSAIAKALQKNAVYFESSKLYDNQVPEWINNYVKDINYTIAPKATFLLSEFLGNDLSKITNEINKLVISLPKGSEITADLVQDNIGISKDFNVFELQDALAKKDILKANRIINYFAFNEKEHPAVMVLSSLYGYFSKILKFHFLQDKSKFAAAGALGVNPFFVDGYAKAAANYNTGKLKSIFSYLKECDLKAKGVNNPSIENGELLKELVFKILH
ncbi:MAG: DNA polymerase III subunit delta [Bacteroidota bacterium]|nr:DNA polymerase III subunit delta [Bacteroidota bacterium]MDP3146371.1 DNA polymerase III subunit delta [Bacteroidota bacterium]MDP3556336.1 DNA polymerase III subunit delta [Bacteroidota bacterium]